MSTTNHLRMIARIVPFFFVVGAGMELFMIKTGFYDIVTRKEAERRIERDFEYERQVRRMKELRIKVPGGGGADESGDDGYDDNNKNNNNNSSNNINNSSSSRRSSADNSSNNNSNTYSNSHNSTNNSIINNILSNNNSSNSGKSKNSGATLNDSDAPIFIACPKFERGKEGYYFGSGDLGLGYYKDGTGRSEGSSGKTKSSSSSNNSKAGAKL